MLSLISLSSSNWKNIYFIQSFIKANSQLQERSATTQRLQATHRRCFEYRSCARMGNKTVLHLVGQSTWKVQSGLNCVVPSQVGAQAVGYKCRRLPIKNHGSGQREWKFT